MAVEQVDYADGDVALTGFLVKPEGAPRAAVLVLPTIANCNTPMIRRAHMLAQTGYLVMIADFYGVQSAISIMRANWQGPCARVLRDIASGFAQGLPP